jgi:putative oxygen-independent coproporphyrinogen III oxidase
MAQTTPIHIAPAAPLQHEVAHFLRPGTLRLGAIPPLSLYVHFPWCVHKCPYCDFNSHEHPGGIAAIPEDAYLDALRADLEAALPLVWGRKVHSVFIGGGTPSLLSAAGLERLLGDIRALLPLVPDCEITLEANPGTVEAQRFAAYRAAGVNRLSLGIQSFDDAMLRALGRIHDGAQARAAIDVAQRHFENFNLDLMYALPGQDLADCVRDAEAALAVAPPHLSLYQLTLEPNTVFAKYPPSDLPDEDTAAAMQEHIEAATADAGYDHYEVSAYAQPGRRSRHNLNYWQFGDYLGIGAGAHSKLSFPHRIVRQVRLRQPASYLAAGRSRSFVAESVEVQRADLPFEFMLNALRLSEGFTPADFSARTGLALGAIEAPLGVAETRGLISRTHERIAPTERGRRFLSDLQALFLPARRDAPK